MSRNTGLVVLLVAFFVGGVSIASAQPLLDRVLDRVDQELDRRLPADAGPAPEDEVIVDGVEPGYLGVVANNRDDQGRGVIVLQVAPNGPANGVIAKNDYIVSIDEAPIKSMDDMSRILTTLPAGARVAFGLQRGAAARTVTVTLGRRPPPNERLFQNFGRQPDNAANPLAPAGERPRLGVRTLPVSDDVRRQMGLPNREGAHVISVTDGLPASRAGVPTGAVITQVNGQIVESPEHLAQLVAAAGAQGALELTFVADGETQKRQVAFGRPTPAAPKPLAFKRTPQVTELPAPSDAEPLEANPPPRGALEQRMQQIEDRLDRIEKLLEAKADGK